MPIGESQWTERNEQSVNNTDKTRVGAFSGPQIPSTQVIREINQVKLQPSYSYGQSTAGTWTQLNEDDNVKVGDILRIKYSLIMPFFQQWQTDHIVNSLNSDTRFRLRAIELYEEKRLLIVEVETVKDFSPAFLIPVVIIGVLAGALIYLTTSSIEKLSTVKIGDFEFKGTPFIFLAILGAAIFFTIKR